MNYYINLTDAVKTVSDYQMHSNIVGMDAFVFHLDLPHPPDCSVDLTKYVDELADITPSGYAFFCNVEYLVITRLKLNLIEVPELLSAERRVFLW